MNKEKTKTTLDKIEKLIVDGQKELLTKIENVEFRLGQQIQGLTLDTQALKLEMRALKQKVDKIDIKHDTNARALYDLLKDTGEHVKRIENKLDEHIRQPSHV